MANTRKQGEINAPKFKKIRLIGASLCLLLTLGLYLMGLGDSFDLSLRDGLYMSLKVIDTCIII